MRPRGPLVSESVRNDRGVIRRKRSKPKLVPDSPRRAAVHAPADPHLDAPSRPASDATAHIFPARHRQGGGGAWPRSRLARAAGPAARRVEGRKPTGQQQEPNMADKPNANAPTRHADQARESCARVRVQTLRRLRRSTNVSLTIFKGRDLLPARRLGLRQDHAAAGCSPGFESPTFRPHPDRRRDMADIPPYERPVNMMFQSYALFPHMSVEKNVAFGLEQEACRAPRSPAGRRDARHRQARRVRGASRTSCPAASASVALARALVKRPKLLLLDEPLGARPQAARARRSSS